MRWGKDFVIVAIDCRDVDLFAIVESDQITPQATTTRFYWWSAAKYFRFHWPFRFQYVPFLTHCETDTFLLSQVEFVKTRMQSVGE